MYKKRLRTINNWHGNCIHILYHHTAAAGDVYQRIIVQSSGAKIYLFI